MSNLRRSGASNFGLISGCVGLALCLGQSYKGHVDAQHERDRMQEMHEQKMHFLHEFHRQQLHAKDHRIAAMEADKRAVEAERLAGMYSEKSREDTAGSKAGRLDKERKEDENKGGASQEHQQGVDAGKAREMGLDVGGSQ